MSVLRNTLLSAAAIAMSVSTAMAGDKASVNGGVTIVAKLLILPGDNSSTGYSDLNSPAREISLDGAFIEGSSSHSGQNDQNNRTEIHDDAGLGKIELSITKAHRPVTVKRKISKAKKSRAKIVKLSLPRQIVKRRAALMIGVYR